MRSMAVALLVVGWVAGGCGAVIWVGRGAIWPGCLNLGFEWSRR